MEINENIKNMFFLLRNKDHMLISDANNYNSLVNFIRGYELGLCLFLDKPIPNFNDWLMAKEQKRFSSNWSFYILQKNKGNEEYSKKMLLDYFEMYIRYLISTVQSC